MGKAVKAESKKTGCVRLAKRTYNVQGREEMWSEVREEEQGVLA